MILGENKAVLMSWNGLSKMFKGLELLPLVSPSPWLLWLILLQENWCQDLMCFVFFFFFPFSWMHGLVSFLSRTQFSVSMNEHVVPSETFKNKSVAPIIPRHNIMLASQILLWMLQPSSWDYKVVFRHSGTKQAGKLLVDRVFSLCFLI